jgi:hypothetical protein
MCWITQDIPVERVAREDIPVFKYVFTDDLRSYYFKNYKYVIGEALYAILGIPFPVIGFRGALSVGSGFHSYGTACIVKEYDRSLNVYPPQKRYHIGSYNLYKLRRIECTIPKGSRYYVNDDLEYVSDKIIVNRITKEY